MFTGEYNAVLTSGPGGLFISGPDSVPKIIDTAREFREEGRDLKYPNIEKFEAMYEIVADPDDWDAPFVPSAPWDPAVQRKIPRQFGSPCLSRC